MPRRPDHDIERIKSAHEMDLMTIEGVEGVGIGKLDGKPCLTVQVRHATRDLKRRIPAEIAGHAVRIDEIGRMQC